MDLRSHTPQLPRPSCSWDILLQLKDCIRRRDLSSGRKLHREAVESGYHKTRSIANALITLYSKCREMANARAVFDSMPHRDVVSWTNVLLGYVENGSELIALDLFTSMDCQPDSVTLVAALKACTASDFHPLFRLEKGMEIHALAKELGVDGDIFLSSTLVDMYCKTGDMTQAREVFNRMRHRNAVAWNTLILGYVEKGECHTAMDLFQGMDCQPNNITFVAGLKACSGLASQWPLDKKMCAEKGMEIHRRARELGLGEDKFVSASLVDVYSKCGFMRHARAVFDGAFHRDVVLWNNLLLGYVENGESTVALELLSCMDSPPDPVTFLAAFKACRDSAKRLGKEFGLSSGMALHRQAKHLGFARDVYVASAMVDMYSACSCMRLALEVFESSPVKDVVIWNTLALGYVENGESFRAMELLANMDCEPDCVTFIAVLKASGSSRALSVGRRIHKQIREVGLEQDQVVATCLVDFYAKCGDMTSAEQVFQRMVSRDVVSWGALLAGYSSLGDISRVFTVVKEMVESGLEMNGVTMVLFLTACSHAGMLEQGRRMFECCVSQGSGLTLEHYSCMVDMLGRANRLQEALALVNSMPFEPNDVVWRALLAACGKWNNAEIGRHAFLALKRLEETFS